MKPGELIFISNRFFRLINDPHLMKNKSRTYRPHYFAFNDKFKKGQLWVVPLSSRIRKYDQISKHSQRARKLLLKVRVRRKISYLLFADMFPTLRKYTEVYFKAQHPMILRRKDIGKAEHYAKRTLSMLNHGIKFGSTFPNVSKIKAVLNRVK